jgi:hypothetical protein
MNIAAIGPQAGQVGPALVNEANIGGCGMNWPEHPKGAV